MQNFYKLIKKERVHNPGYQKHGLELPFYGLIIGGSGSGKTNTLLQVISLSSGSFTRICICLRTKEEPLYELLAKKCPDVEFFENEVPDIDTFQESESSLIVFDDLVLKKDQSDIQEYFIRGRKLNITCIYISQSYYRIPKLIRINCRYIFLKKLSSVKDLKLIVSEYNLDKSVNELLDIYKNATNNFTDFLNIDINKNSFKVNFI